MKKSLIALAALAAVGAASAQSSVTLYGLVDIGYGSHTTTSRDGSNTIRSRGVIEGSNASNRIGFMGTEDLGGGLKANFLIEQGISPTNPQLFATRVVGLGHQVEGQNPSLAGKGAFSNSTNRQSYLGLTSSTIGTFNIGRQYSIADQLASLSGYNIGAENSVGATAHLAGMLGPIIVGTRANVIQYISPNFGGGFVARAQYGSGDNRGSTESSGTLTNGLTTDNVRRMALMLQYANGPLSASAAYTNVRMKTVNGVAGLADALLGTLSEHQYCPNRAPP